MTLLGAEAQKCPQSYLEPTELGFSGHDLCVCATWHFAVEFMYRLAIGQSSFVPPWYDPSLICNAAPVNGVEPSTFTCHGVWQVSVSYKQEAASPRPSRYTRTPSPGHQRVLDGPLTSVRAGIKASGVQFPRRSCRWPGIHFSDSVTDQLHMELSINGIFLKLWVSRNLAFKMYSSQS